jgi:hypothetical protein
MARNLANRFYNWLASWLTRVEILILHLVSERCADSSVDFLHIYPSGFSTPTTITGTAQSWV